MTDAVQKVLDLVRALPRDEQEVVLSALIDSLDPPPTSAVSQAEIDAGWREEIRRRVANYRAGTATLIDADEVFASLRAGARR